MHGKRPSGMHDLGIVALSVAVAFLGILVIGLIAKSV